MAEPTLLSMAEPTEMELQRQRRIEENRARLLELGVVEAQRQLAAAALSAGGEQAPRCKRRKLDAAPPTGVPLEPTRLSRRLRGQTAPSLEQAAAAGRAEAEAEGRAAARAGGARKQLRLEEGQQLAAPFSLWSIGVTVWELGHVHRGAWAHRYWSSPGCLYHHACPVGYRATKVHFGRTYEMRIEEGPSGPVFKVIDQQTGAVFSGQSPTKPWTDVCIAHRTGQRISGPLFFGFSDAITQRAIAANLYGEEELRAALQGEKLESQADSPEERAAREIAAVEGVGEATAIVLARTAALGGSRHAGLASLKAWAGASDANARLLHDFLTGSEEVPEGTRRWPAWRQRIAPRIVLALSGRWLGSGPALGVEEAAGQGGAASGGGTQAGQEEQGAGDGAVEDSSSDGAGQMEEQSNPQQQQLEQLQGPAAEETADERSSPAKENWRPAGSTKGAKAAAAPASHPQAASQHGKRGQQQQAGGQQQARASGRERRVNRKFADCFVLSDDEGEA